MPEGMNEIWDQIREHHGDLAGLKASVGTLGTRVGEIGAKLDAVLDAVTRHSAKQGPGLMQIMSGLATLLAIIGGLSAGIAIFVGNTYEPKFASLQGDLNAARAALAIRRLKIGLNSHDYAM
jgi:hypothetical protein